MACSGRFAEAADYDALMCAGMDLTDPTILATVELYLDLAAADIHSAMAASDMCSCSLAAWTTNYLKKLNILDAAVIQQCPCGSMTDDMKSAYINWLNGQLELIRTGKIELCSGETGSEFPAFGDVPRAWTDWNTAEIMYQTLMKTP